MVPPLLKLEFTQGPRDGDSLEFKPGSTIRLGRIARGNEIAIKDAGISTKHLRIVSDSYNWIIHDLGSSNGTMLNTETVEPDTPVNLSHGDTVKLGEYTSFVVNFVTDVQAQEHKLPPRPRRNNKRLAISDDDPDPTESVQEKPSRKGRSSKQDNASSKENSDEHEVPKRTRASKKRNLEDITDKVKELEVVNEKMVNSRVGRARKQESKAITRGKSNGSVRKLGLNSIKLEAEETPEGVEISEVKSRKRVTSDDRCDEEMVEQGSSNKNVERVDLGKLELGKWFEFLKVQLRKEIIEDTEKMIELMRSKALRVHKHIAEHREKIKDRASLI